MTFVVSSQVIIPLTFEEFLASDDGSDRNFEINEVVKVNVSLALKLAGI
ncbi:MAG: hypothetical protein NW220_06360 [Leptolyngbyaceae cyanobacterium bins.349]|nr:hypothetical protein [Leptolyngbyaceae cyanobacterium bins.349]